jgi:hypothetical protein
MPPTGGMRYCFNHRRGPAAAHARSQARAAGGRARGAQQSAASAQSSGAHSGAPHTTPPPTIVYAERPWYWWELFGPGDVEEGLAHVARETIAGRMPARQAAVAVKALQTLLSIAQDAHKDGERPFSSLDDDEDEDEGDEEAVGADA